jgi:transposase-like protein
MKRTDAEKSGLVVEQQRSGESVAVFCRRLGIDSKTFYVWRARYGAQGAESTERFARINTSNLIELELKGGVQIRVAKPDLKAVLEALQCAE